MTGKFADKEQARQPLWDRLTDEELKDMPVL